ncbi:nucleotidyltransferase family protein [Natribacillus halophilus]|uniref:Molybdenum cofactor cytidylyltransferase n=1 Tax=Natribacillus halophilus TaxID=549003 RepID=A0A1G8N1D0_9BACI|nr:nucleotidyltransferase family protein [Natribacillus halophilus]SDI73877.1 molybdenum cofactor cytidylyltransferase [Natribacillus halophilus]
MTTSEDHNLSALLLAAGRSQRMGTLKAALPWNGTSLIEFQVNQLQNPLISELIVVTGYKSEEIAEMIKPSHVKIVYNHRFHEGKTSSIRKGVEVINPKSKGILISAVDQPVPKHTLDLMITHFNKTNASIVVPVYKQKRGHPVLFNAHLKHELLKVNEETQGLRNIFRKFNHHVSLLEVSDPNVLLNLNTPIDFLHMKGEKE